MTDARPPRRPTLEDVARRAGVSRALVSIVIRGAPGASSATRDRVLRIAAELGYRPDARARLLARRSNQLIGVVFNVQHAFHADLLAGIYVAADTVGYEIVLSGTTPAHDEQSSIDALLGYRCDALLLLGPEGSERRIAQLGTRLPVVVVGRRVAAAQVDRVHTDDAAGMCLAVEHLVALGHEDIVHVDGGPNAKAADRRRGYRAAMEAAGLAGRARVVPGGQTAELGAAAGALISSLDPLPSAAVAFDDDCAFGVTAALRAAGIAVPRDVSIVGYDGSRFSRFPLSDLTTVGQDAAAMASLAVARAVARLEGYEGTERDIVLAPTLLVRGSTARPRGAGLNVPGQPPPLSPAVIPSDIVGSVDR
ncbi:MAG TPA: LacI family DNA-binding transcriptional regulator [Patescibacteria group bacterium]|nr:LacI family DNA-binding transcriptional regulator [Patescibacteria group bacterium]